MKSSLRLLLALTLGLAASAFAADTKPAAPVAAYPLKTCIVSDEELGGMGKPIEYVHREAGKPDRTVLLCCKDCIADFKKEPAKYLAKLDAAAAKPAKK